VNIGVAAHITAAAEGGPRFDPSVSDVQRRSVSNGIWLCQNCAKLIDNDAKKYHVSKLQEWKKDAEASAANAISRRTQPSAAGEGVFMEAERLMPDLIAEMRRDLKNDDSELIREFIVHRQRGLSYWAQRKQFVYYETDYSDLRNKIDWLAEMCLVRDVTRTEVTTYRILDDFANWLRQ